MRGESFCKVCRDGVRRQVCKQAAEWIGKSEKQHSRLRGLAEALNFPALELLAIHQVRWLSRGMAIERLVTLLLPLLEAWKEEGNKLFHRLCNFKLLFLLHGLADVLPLLNRLNKQFQEDITDVISVGSSIAVVISTLLRIASLLTRRDY